MSTPSRSPARSPKASPKTSPRGAKSPASPAAREKEIQKLESEYPELADPDILGLRKTRKPTKESTVGDPQRLTTMEWRDPDRMTLIEKLRILKRQAITDCDFDKSNAIQRYIDLKVIVDIDGVIAKAKAWLQEGIEAAVENYNANVEDINAEASDKKIRIRGDCDNIFQNMQKRHVDELTEIYMDQEIAVKREVERLPADYRGMTRQAQKLASQDDTESAKAMHAKAEEIRCQQVQARQEKMKERYDKIADQTIKKQEGELELVQSSLANLLNECDRNLEADLREQRRKLAVYVKHSLIVAIQSSCDWLEMIEARTRVSTELTQFVKKLMKDMNKEDLLTTTD